VVILDASGNKLLEVSIPAGIDVDMPTPFPPTREPKPGWDFPPSGPKYDGRPVKIQGRQREVLKALAAAEGPLMVDQLAAAWADYKPEPGTVRGVVIELRKTLKNLFPEWEGETIEATGEGYTLLLR
jgi:hypothetical protein